MRYRIFTWKPKSGKNHRRRKIYYNPLITCFTEIVCQGLSAELFFFRIKGVLPSLARGEGPFIHYLICVHRGRWYGHDPRNHMICTCWFVVTVVIIGAWLLSVVRVKFWPLQMSFALLLIGIFEREAGERSWWRIPGALGLTWCLWSGKGLNH